MAAIDFVDGGFGASFLHIQGKFPMYSPITFTWNKSEKEQTAGKLARDVLGKWVGFFGTPDVILAYKDVRFAGGFHFSATIASSLYRQLFLEVSKV